MKKCITSSEKGNASCWALLFGERLTLQITPTVTYRVLKNSKETEGKTHRNLLFLLTCMSLVLTKLKSKYQKSLQILCIM